MAILAGGLAGATLLLVAEFTPLFYVYTPRTGARVETVGTGSHHAFAMIPIALLVGALACGAWASASRPALVSIGVLAVIALGISLLVDLPDAHASGLIGSSSARFVGVNSTPAVGMYLETLAAAFLLITSVCGWLWLGAVAPAQARRRQPD
ncbi:MAG: hypothetical protein JO153_01885 [Solirubrobacterales bacterium]|nr:hypothetical protein [Solirubrobacterales bacterium]